MNRLDGKIALISGAARGIGAETARLMVEAGARIIIGDILDERGRETAREIGGGDSAAIFHHLDVTSQEDWSGAVGAAVARWGGLDILINNAGMFLGKGIEEASLNEWHRLCAVNLTGVFLGTKLAVSSLRERGKTSPHGSAVVNLASVAGLVGSQLDPLYSMTKGGVTLFTKSAALEFARKATASASTQSIRVSFRPIWVSRLSLVVPETSAPTMSMRRDKSHCRPTRSADSAHPPTSPRASCFSPRMMPAS
jgi:3(or 17)beta-hydroxysteroid dehydrogenase